MTTLYSVCAVIGGTVLICQFIMALVGLSGDHDLSDVDADLDFGDAHAGSDASASGADSSPGHHHSSTWFFGVISFRTVVAAMTFFGLVGLAVQSGGSGPVPTLTIAAAAGAAAMYGVHWLMQQMSRLNADGTIGIRDAVGRTGTVYLKVQGGDRGAGKVTLHLRNRTVEFEARTRGEELPTGTPVVVLGVIGPETVEVGRAPSPSEVTHV